MNIGAYQAGMDIGAHQRLPAAGGGGSVPVFMHHRRMLGIS